MANFAVTHLNGSMDRPRSFSVLRSLLAELKDATPERPGVTVSHEHWALSIFDGGRLIWGNVEDGDDWYLTGLSDEEVLELMEHVALGNIEGVLEQPWTTKPW